MKLARREVTNDEFSIAPSDPPAVSLPHAALTAAPIRWSSARRAGSEYDESLRKLRRRVATLWLLRLRVAVAMFLLGIVGTSAAGWAGAEVRGGAALGIAAMLLLITSAALYLPLRRGAEPNPKFAAGILLLDAGILSAVLALTGGAANPYSVLYLVQIVIAALVLGERWTWAMCAVCVAAFGVQFQFLDGHHGMTAAHGEGEHFSSHLQGMWNAFTIAACAVAAFVCRIVADLRRSEDAAAAMRLQVAESERFASIATLAAGTAHELGTPLNTITVIADELRAFARDSSIAPEIRDDLELLKNEVRRCRTVLDEMRLQADGANLEQWEIVHPEKLEAVLRSELGPALAGRVRIESELASGPIRVPFRGLINVLKGLVRNGAHAALAESPIRLQMRSDHGQLAVTVEDSGEGMSREVLERCCDPFFTTKPPGQGMGLGLFLARLFCERNGGRIEIVSEPGRGCAVTVVVGERNG